MTTSAKDDALELFITLTKAYKWVSAHADRDIRKRGLSTAEFGVLELLYHKGSQPIQQIGCRVLMSSGNLTYVVDKLEKKGLVARRSCTEDRRLTYADITEAGRQFIEEQFPGHCEVIAQAVGGLSPEERQIATVLLRKLGKAAQDGYG